MKIMVILMVIGIITALAGIIGEFYLKTPVSDKVLGVYTGLGSSFFAAGLVLWIKNKTILNNEEKLKECR